MVKDYETNKPTLETDRLIIRPLNVNDAAETSVHRRPPLGKKKTFS